MTFCIKAVKFIHESENLLLVLKSIFLNLHLHYFRLQQHNKIKDLCQFHASML